MAKRWGRGRDVHKADLLDSHARQKLQQVTAEQLEPVATYILVAHADMYYPVRLQYGNACALLQRKHTGLYQQHIGPTQAQAVIQATKEGVCG